MDSIDKPETPGIRPHVYYEAEAETGQFYESQGWESFPEVVAWVNGLRDTPGVHTKSFDCSAGPVRYRCNWLKPYPGAAAPDAKSPEPAPVAGTVGNLTPEQKKAISEQWAALNGGRNPGETLGPIFLAPDRPELRAEVPLRDWLAGQALPGIIAKGVILDSERQTVIAYRFADAMLKAREGKPKPVLQVEILSYGSTNQWLALADLTLYPEARTMLAAGVTGVVFRSGAHDLRVTEVPAAGDAA